MQFRYKKGDTPLDGYTIEHAVGRGGFGEVYYALSDAGREVALKAVLNYEDIEVRGISSCMNIKSPYLVSIFDIKKNAEGQPFVIMEYIAGSSLRTLIDDAPQGMGAAKAGFLLKEIAKGLAVLHDRGIVHRDLKPSNIFYEDGFVKIGDYSLSKAMSTTHHTEHTITVGTVHYMAPEISKGIYDRSIDIYALGVILHEMITGRPVYEGDSPGEILMKHLASSPDVSGIEAPFAKVIKKAMASKPSERYASVEEMVKDLLGAEGLDQQVSLFAPESLTSVGTRVTPTPKSIPFKQEQVVAAKSSSTSSSNRKNQGPKPAERPRPEIRQNRSEEVSKSSFGSKFVVLLGIAFLILIAGALKQDRVVSFPLPGGGAMRTVSSSPPMETLLGGCFLAVVIGLIFWLKPRRSGAGIFRRHRETASRSHAYRAGVATRRFIDNPYELKNGRGCGIYILCTLIIGGGVLFAGLFFLALFG